MVFYRLLEIRGKKPSSFGGSRLRNTGSVEAIRKSLAVITMSMGPVVRLGKTRADISTLQVAGMCHVWLVQAPADAAHDSLCQPLQVAQGTVRSSIVANILVPYPYYSCSITHTSDTPQNDIGTYFRLYISWRSCQRSRAQQVRTGSM